MKSPTEIQQETSRLRCNMKIDLENLRHQHIMEEIEALKKAKITSFVRQVKDYEEKA